MEHIISVDIDKCIGCSQCIFDCPVENIELDSCKKAVVKSQKCLKCGHCTAVCPKEAVSISGYSEEPYLIENMEKIDAEKLMNSLISRRSIRRFKDSKVPEDFIKKIIEAGRWTPTGKNAQDVEYIIIDKSKRKVEDMAIKVFKKLLKIINIFSKSFRHMEIDDDFFFKKAPIAILVIANSKVDGSLAASNMALMAESLGLGVLYSGFFTIAAALSGKIKKELGIKGKKPVTTLVIGYPKVKYRRNAQKDDAIVYYR